MIGWLPNYNHSNIVVALRAALAAAAILYVLEIYDIKNGMGHLGFLAVVLSCFAKPSALGDIFPFALLLIKGLIVTVPLMTGFVVFMRGQDQKSRSAFNFALPVVTFVGSFFITWTPWVPRPTRPVQCTLFYISIATARKGVDVYGPLRLAATVGIGDHRLLGGAPDGPLSRASHHPPRGRCIRPCGNQHRVDGMGRPEFASTQAFATATVVGAIEGVCRDMLKSADVVPNLLLLFPPAPAATIPARKGE